MESAIPAHLRTDRTRTRRIADDYAPAAPGYAARFRPAVQRVTMAYFGIQFAGSEPASAQQALDWIAVRFASAEGAVYWDRASYIDEAGFTNIVSVGYWNDQARFERWFLSTQKEWTDEHHFLSQLGRFIEVLSPSMQSLETLFSSVGRPEGVARLADAMSGEIQEHAYWGGMRDRIPLSQTDEMSPHGNVRYERSGSRTRIFANENLCLIRSGQDWSEMEREERDIYLNDIEPVLREGMNFLRDEGRSIGCYANRYMAVLGPDGKPVERSYGMSWWKSLSALERWAESHPTHVAIFGTAMKYYKTLGPAAKLRLYHEVTIARATEQFFEYFNCHERTGMLRSVILG